MSWNKNLIGENAGVVWRTLGNDEMSWEELLRKTAITPLLLASAIGWLARENKLSIRSCDGTVYFRVYYENFF